MYVASDHAFYGVKIQTILHLFFINKFHILSLSWYAALSCGKAFSFSFSNSIDLSTYTVVSEKAYFTSVVL
jgi:hypothetical protein